MEDSPTRRKRKMKFKDISANLSKEELIRRLKSAAQEFKNIDQGENTSEFDELSANLVTPFIIKHKDKDVKSYAACCLADVLRIYAPEPPYNEVQLKDIFGLLLRQLKGLENVSGPLYGKYFYILESLALVKTFNVCLELDAQNIILDLFKLFFTIVSDQHNIRVKTFMLDVMSPLIQESDSLPQELLEVILVHLIDPRKSKFPSSYKLACDLLDRCSAALEPYVQLFFNNSFILGGEVEGELKGNLYDLLYELFKVNKSVLLSVLPQLEFKLKGQSEEERLEAIRLLGRMFSEDDSTLADSNRALWNCYLGRFLDISTNVRIECIHISKQFLTSNTQKLKEEVSEQLQERFLDMDEKVRLETVLVVCEAAANDFNSISDKILDGVKDRMRDKKWSIRREAITCIGKLYKKIYGCNTSSAENLERLSWVPSKVLHLYGQNNIDDRLCIERVFHGCIIPVTLDMEERMKRLLHVFHDFDELAHNFFTAMMKHRAKVTSDLSSLLIYSQLDDEEESLDKRKRTFHAKILAVARNLPEPLKAQEHLKKFIQLCKDKNLYDMLLAVTDGTHDCPKILKTVTEIVKKFAKSPIIETLKSLLDRACPMLLDKPSFLVFVKYIKRLLEGVVTDDADSESTDEELILKAKSGLRLVKLLASARPSIFQTKQCYETLLIFVKHKDDKIVEDTLRSLFFVISEIENVDKTLCSCFQTVLSKLVTHGTCNQSKYSLRCLNKMLKDPQLTMQRIFKNLLDKLDLGNSNRTILTTLAGLSEMSLLSPEIFETKYKEIIREFVVRKIMVVDREPSRSSQENSEQDEWCPDYDVSQEALIKMQSIKLLTHWLLGLQSNHAERALPVFRMFNTILVNDGDLTEKGQVSAQDKSRLRLAAGNALLKLVSNTNYVDVIELDQYQQLSMLLQDSCFEVRDIFTTKLQKYLDTLKLALDYLAFLVLVAVDPSKERKIKVRHLISRNATARREYIKQHSAAAARPYAVLPEYSIPYVIHLLAHHSDFDHTEVTSLRQTKEYLWFFLEPIMGAKAENYSFLKKLIENIKQTKDKQDPDNPVAHEKLYAVCDLAVTCIMHKNHTFTLKDFPGKLVLPKKLFIQDKSMHNTKSYLPTNFILSPKKSKVDGKAVSVKESIPVHNGNHDNESEEEVVVSPKKRKRPASSTKKAEISSNTEKDLLKKAKRNLNNNTFAKDASPVSDKKRATRSRQPVDEVCSSKIIKNIKKPTKQLKLDAMLKAKPTIIPSPMNGNNGDVTSDDDERPPMRISSRKSPQKKLGKANSKYIKSNSLDADVNGDDDDDSDSTLADIQKVISPQKHKAGLQSSSPLNRNSDDVTDGDEDMEDERLAIRLSPRKSLQKKLTKVNTKIAVSKSFDVDMNGIDEDSDSKLADIQKSISPNKDSPNKDKVRLQVRRKGRSRR